MESNSPPTVTQLAKLGREFGGVVRSQSVGPSAHPEVGAASGVSERIAWPRKVVRSIQRFCEQNSVSELACGFGNQDREFLAELVAGFQLRLEQITAVVARVNGVTVGAEQAPNEVG